MMKKETFEYKPEHGMLLRNMHTYFEGCAYYGAPAINVKRPYGNSDVIGDIHYILTGKKWDHEECEDIPCELQKTYLDLHQETATALEVVLNNLGSFSPYGTYERDLYGGKWELVGYLPTPIVE